MSFQGQRYLTRGVQTEIPFDLQMFMWYLIDHLPEPKDYLQVFRLSVSDDGTQRVVHEQEEPEYRKEYDIQVDKVYFDSSYNIMLYMGDVKVSLGSSKDFTDRLFELKQLSAKFGSLKGTLYLDNYNGDESSIIFKREK